MPVSVSVPAATVKPPAPLMSPEYEPLAWVSVRSLPAAVTTLPLPDSVLIDAPLVVALMSNVPLSATPLDAAIEPLPLRASFAPEATLVAPV